jgi:glycosyltransferase involved in cell wall biosynthesis
MDGDPLKTARSLWRAVAPHGVRSMAQPLSLQLALSSVRRSLSDHATASKPGPLLVSGLINETKGVSEAARLTINALKAAGYPVIPLDLRLLLQARSAAEAALPLDGDGGVWLIHANAPEALKALARLNPAHWRGRYRIGYWAYELPVAPPLWVAASKAFHEIWVPSRFVADALEASGVGVPIRVMPHPVATGERLLKPDREAFLIPRDAFAVLAIGDLRSSATRKNLLGAIDIYRRTFPSPDPKSVLVLKTQSDDAHPAFRAQAEAAAGGRRDIVFITQTLSQSDVRRLIASVDVLLSPHRAEGFGLALAEALLAGVPALATGWSGNLDFMCDLPELLIKNAMVAVSDPKGVYRSAGLMWAEPDIDDAVVKLGALARDPALRRHLAIRGGAAVERLSHSWAQSELDATALGRLVLPRADGTSMRAGSTV